MDGTVKLWDMTNFRLASSHKVGTSEASYPLSIALDVRDRIVFGFAVGLLNKTIKYFEIDQS